MTHIAVILISCCLFVVLLFHVMLQIAIPMKSPAAGITLVLSTRLFSPFRQKCLINISWNLISCNDIFLKTFLSNFELGLLRLSLGFLHLICNLHKVTALQVDAEPGEDVDVVAVDEHLLPLRPQQLQHLGELGGGGVGQGEGSGGGGGGEERPGWGKVSKEKG